MSSSGRDSQFVERIAAAKKMLGKYPNRIPVIINIYDRCTSLPEIAQKKYLTPDDMTVAQFTRVLRDKIELKESQTLFLFCCSNDGKKTLLCGSDTMFSVYSNYHKEDLFLHVIYSSEDTFGSAQ